MSSNHKPIRIIKCKQRESAGQQPEVLEVELKSETQSTRQIFNTITMWIEEQREAKRELERRTGLLLGSASSD